MLTLPRMTPEEIEERAADAKDFLNNKSFRRVMEHLREAYIQELTGTPPGTSQVGVAHAKLYALGDLEATLHSFVYSGKKVSGNV